MVAKENSDMIMRAEEVWREAWAKAHDKRVLFPKRKARAVAIIDAALRQSYRDGVEALRLYVTHQSKCELRRSGDYCTCGLARLLEKEGT